MSDGQYRFGDFRLDTEERLLHGPGGTIELNARYFDALALLVREPGRLIAKERFMAEVWSGVPVGDEALTQCMATLRRRLGDSARNPRFIQTVPKHGYRFVAEVERPDAAGEVPALGAPADNASAPAWARVLSLTAAGTAGGGAAGVAGGLIYGAAIAFGPAAPEVGAVSIFMLLCLLNIVVGLAGGLAVSLGWSAARVLGGRSPVWPVLGGAAGGFAVGALTSVLGLDVFHLLLGQAPARMTSGPEGAALGAAVGLGLAVRHPGRAIAAAAACAAVAGGAIVLAGGTLMAGSLDSLSASIAGSGAPLQRIAPFFAAVSLDGGREVLLGLLEGVFFGGAVAAAVGLVRRRQTPAAPAN